MSELYTSISSTAERIIGATRASSKRRADLLDDRRRSLQLLGDRIAKSERRVAMLAAILRLVLTLLRLSDFKLERARVPDAANKRRLLSAIERAHNAMPLTAALRVLQFLSRGLSAKSSRIPTWSS